MLCNYRTGERSPQQILVLINRARFEGREDVSRQELLAQVLDNDLAGPGLIRLIDDRLDVIALSHIADHGDHVVGIVFLQPWNDDRSVESTGVSKNHFFRHVRSSRAGARRRPAEYRE